MRKKLTCETFDAYEVYVDLGSDLQEYAMNFLKIFNNVKSNKELIRVTNDYGSKVAVVCQEDSLNATKEFLSWFGSIISVEKVLCVKIEEDIDYDFDKYDDLVVVPYMDQQNRGTIPSPSFLYKGVDNMKNLNNILASLLYAIAAIVCIIFAMKYISENDTCLTVLWCTFAILFKTNFDNSMKGE